MQQEQDDFASAIARAQRVMGADGGLFPPDSVGRVAVEGAPNRVGLDLNFDAHVGVFSLPTDRGEYEAVLNQALRGEAVVRYEEKTFTKDGDFIVAVCWMTPRVRPPQQEQEVGDAEAPVLPHRIP